MTMRLPSLTELLTYKNNFVIEQFMQQKSISIEEASQHFCDLLSWMWLSVFRKQNNKETHMFGPLIKLDELWHCFILNTNAYFEFCEKFFGSYFHHEVEPVGKEKVLTENELFEFISDCYDHLGEAWVLRCLAQSL